MNINELKTAVVNLSENEVSEFRIWLEEYFAAKWDEKIAEDAESGRLDGLIAEAEMEYATNKLSQL